jgi:site-specific DNA recombinase
MTADLRALCAREGFEEVALHVDDGKSGAVRDRPEFMGWLADAREGRADVLVAWHVDRMTREGLNVAATLLDVVEGKDPTTGRVVYPPVRLMDAKGIDSDDGSSFRFMFVIAAEVARAERERIKDRVAASIQRRRKGEAAGGFRYAGGNRPFGYRSAPNPSGPGRVLVPDAVEAERVREAASRVLSGETVYSIARSWNDRTPPVPTRRKTAWTVQALGQVLTGHSVVGRVVVRGEMLRGPDGMPLAIWEPILDLDTWHRVRALLESRRESPVRQQARQGRAVRLLSGLAVCGECGAPLYVRTPSPKTPDKKGYACSGRSNGRACPGVYVSAAPLEGEVESRFLRAFGRLPVTLAEEVEVEDPRRAELEAAIRDTTEEMRAPGADIAALAARLQMLAAQRDGLPARSAREVRRVSTGRTFAETWQAHGDDGDVAAQRSLLRHAVASIEVTKGRRGTHGVDPARVAVYLQDGGVLASLPATPADRTNTAEIA